MRGIVWMERTSMLFKILKFGTFLLLGDEIGRWLLPAGAVRSVAWNAAEED